MYEHKEDRRTAALSCATCQTPNGPFVYMQSGREYCSPCAVELREIMGLLSAGRRRDDLVLS